LSCTFEIFRHQFPHELNALHGVIPLTLVVNDIDSVPSSALAIDSVEARESMNSFEGVIFQASNFNCLCRADCLDIVVEVPVRYSFGMAT
jgi:hypothetical protein